MAKNNCFSSRALSVLFMLALPHALSADEQRNLDFFEARIRPVLIEHCYACHSSESGAVKGGLNLDSAAGWGVGGDSGPAIEAGQPEASLLMEALRYEGLEMPPEKKLPASTIRDFKKWILDGAVDPRIKAHIETSASEARSEVQEKPWSFQPVKTPSVPRVPNAPASSIDAFILTELAAAGIRPNERAAASTLARRLYVDLTGLVPTAEELDAAVTLINENQADRLADMLLQSPQFGVYWGRHWLDVARYADSNGGDFNATFHNAWRYRDYVVNSMNHDKPFNQFIVEQIAGDLLPFDSDDQRTEQLIATGFLMIGAKMLSERDKDKLQMDVVDEQINTVGSAFLGLTLGCARCHDHKFDPVATTDYYALAGIFRSTRTLEGESQKYVSTWKTTSLPASESQVAAVAAWKQQQTTLKAEVVAAEQRLKELQSMAMIDDRFIVDDTAAQKIGEWKSSKLTPHFIGAGYIHDDQSGKGQKSVVFTWQPPESGKYEVRLSYTSGGGRAKNVPVEIVSGNGSSMSKINQTRKPEHDGLFASVDQFVFAENERVSVTIGTQNTTGHVIVDAVQFVPVDSATGSVVDTSPEDKRDQVELGRQQQRVDELKGQLKQLAKNAPPALPNAIAARDGEAPEDCHVCIRGEHRNTGKLVPRGFITILHPEAPVEIPKNESGRRELAQWIASPQNPLTARVIVNRVWSHLFGEGIVRTIDNFGRLSDTPSHPELLDHLASRFVDCSLASTDGQQGFNWSIKALIREIVLSDAYQRSCDFQSESHAVDTENRLVWRAHRRTLTAESLRDSVLLISGRLDLSNASSPVAGFGTLVKSNDADADDVVLKESNRRSLYMPIIRNELPTILTAFDFADPDLVVGKRPVTNVPAQALFLMNSPFVMDCALKTAMIVCKQDQQPSPQLVQETYRRVLAREPEPHEVALAMEFLGDVSESTDFRLKTGPATLRLQTRLARFIHTMFASTEFRMLD